MTDPQPKLGRIYAPDERDRKFLLSISPEAAAVAESRPYKYHYHKTILDQGDSSACTGAAFWQWLDMGPIRNLNKPDFMTLYKMNQKNDEWSGEEPTYYGSSVRASFKVGQQLGFVKRYGWAFDAETVANHILTSSPVVMGTTWWTDMFRTDSDGFVNVGGRVAGGHAYAFKGFSQLKKRSKGSRGSFRGIQSWGDWGQNGLFWMSFEDADALIKDYGEACTAFEQLAPAQVA